MEMRLVAPVTRGHSFQRVSFLKRVIETGGNESRFLVFDSTAGNAIERPLNRHDFCRVLYDTLPRNDK